MTWSVWERNIICKAGTNYSLDNDLMSHTEFLLAASYPYPRLRLSSAVGKGLYIPFSVPRISETKIGSKHCLNKKPKQASLWKTKLLERILVCITRHTDVLGQITGFTKPPSNDSSTILQQLSSLPRLNEGLFAGDIARLWRFSVPS